MKKLILFLIGFFPILVFAEYNGVHVSFDIQLSNGEKVQGYKYVAFAMNTEEDKKALESKLDVLLRNHFTNQAGEYNYYQKRLRYEYNEVYLFQLIDPQLIDLKEIQSLKIIDMIDSSYDTQIASEHNWEDRDWMKTTPLAKYTEGEELCLYDHFIHQTGEVPQEVIEKIKSILQQSELKLHTKAKEIEDSIASDEAFHKHMKAIYEERTRALKPILAQYKNLKIVIVSQCTC